jgi:hypothetical protein
VHEEIFEDYGNIIVDSSSRAYAFVEYKSGEDEADILLSEMNLNADDEDVEMVEESKFFDQKYVLTNCRIRRA